ncbi:hypothetical protein, conserved in T. vivax [Trypanosoma vivax Y486]|uniref:Uncharacterized protein n=1 Tax=Trypanosoma vivax (strain Y486) TaxID=1055687 RepID=F9WPB4_TRYVY|nr:hypothetical protein, conserved in T. vivax [Trypanosoma vivax Y486]|eukprot:CCD19390.1 hypothetical protein, conserved in T. vivax [Trypanosoma vivax Y486]
MARARGAGNSAPLAPPEAKGHGAAPATQTAGGAAPIAQTAEKGGAPAPLIRAKKTKRTPARPPGPYLLLALWPFTSCSFRFSFIARTGKMGFSKFSPGAPRRPKRVNADRDTKRGAQNGRRTAPPTKARSPFWGFHESSSPPARSGAPRTSPRKKNENRARLWLPPWGGKAPRKTRPKNRCANLSPTSGGGAKAIGSICPNRRTGRL